MTRDTKLLQTLVDGQVAIRSDIKKTRKELGDKIDKLENRINKLGSQLAYLEDDTPTIKEFDKLERRVSKLEKQVASN